ncbi:MAG: SLC13 family permease [Pseudomonadota bacterium]|nr:SLC13 family permease [Pseudomonadota bacterium]
MTADQAILLTILTALLVLLVWGRWRYDIVALGALFTASIFGLVPQSELFSGFGNPATITVVLVLIVSYGLTNSGAVDYLIPLIEPASQHPLLHISVLTFLAAILSMFMNNVGALALLMPVAIQSASKAGRSPATVLMPLSFGSILGGLVTLIGTPPNILIASYREEMTGDSFGMFDFAPVGGGVALAGIVFMLIIGWKLVKVRKQTAGFDLFDIEHYLFETRVVGQSDLVGVRTGVLKDLLTNKKMDLIAMIRGSEEFAPPDRRRNIHQGDYLMLQGSHDDVQEFAAAHALTVHTALNQQKAFTHAPNSTLAEVVVTAASPLVGKTPKEKRINRNYGVSLLAVSRSGTPHQSRLRQFEIRVGDVLLLHGEREALDEAIVKLSCYPLAKRAFDAKNASKAVPATLAFFLAVLAAAVGLVPIQLALGLTTVIMAVSHIIPLREFYEGVDWPVVVLLGAMIPLGGALESTETTELLVAGLLVLVGELSPALILAAILILTMTISDVLNNAATAILMAPIAFNIANGLDYNPDAFLMAVAVGASCAFLTPVGHQNNALIMGPGGYRFGDYWRMGLPLELLIVIVAIPLLLLVWPL